MAISLRVAFYYLSGSLGKCPLHWKHILFSGEPTSETFSSVNESVTKDPLLSVLEVATYSNLLNGLVF